jgi:drug/metabolite transporter (DMT)-like permease
VGAYLVAFSDPFHLAAVEIRPALLAVGAAVLWGLGTVLGRRLSSTVPFGELTGLRLAFGLIAATAVMVGRGES